MCRPVVQEPQTTAFEDERHARLHALSRSVGTADGVPRSRVGVGWLSIVLSVAARAGQVSAPQHKSVPLLIKSADDDSGTFTGLASVFDKPRPRQ